MMREVLNLAYGDLWRPQGAEVRDALGGFEGLAGWFYDEFAKDACGLPSNDGALMASMRVRLQSHEADCDFAQARKC
jgi:hypothetical protein